MEHAAMGIGNSRRRRRNVEAGSMSAMAVSKQPRAAMPEEVGRKVGAEPGIEHEGNVLSGVIYRAGGHHENWGIANTK